VNAADLRTAGFSESEVSQYEQLQGAGFSQDEIIKHFEGEKKPPPPPSKKRAAWYEIPAPQDLLHGVEVGASGFNKVVANILGLPADAIRWLTEQAGVDPEKVPGLRGGVWGGEWIANKFMPRGAVEPESLMEKIIGATGEQAGAMMLPGIGTEAYLANKLAYPVRYGEAALTAGKTAVGAGTGSGLAREYAPDSPILDLVAQFTGGVATGAGPALYRKGKEAYTALKRGAPTLTETQLNQRAGQVLNEATSPEPVYDINTEAAKKLEKEIPGFRATLGERSADPGQIKLQRSLEAGQGDAANLMAQKKAVNNLAVRDYLSNEFKGTETIDDVIEALNTRKASLEKGADWFEAEAGAARAKLPTVGPQETGRAAVGAIEEARIPMSARKDALYSEVGNPPVQTTNTKDAVKAVEAEFSPGEEAVYPSGVIAKIKKVLKGKVTDAELPLAEGPEGPKETLIARAEKSAKKGLETAQSRFQKNKLKLTDDIAVQLKEKGQRNLYKSFDKDGLVTWDKAAQELAGQGEFPGYAAEQKVDQTTFLDWLESNPVLGADKTVYADKLTKATAKLQAAAADTGERGFQELHSLRKDLGRQISDATTGANPNLPMARRLYTLKNAIDADIEVGLGGENAYQVARDFAREYYLKFRSGTVGKVLQKGQQASGRAIPDAEIGKKLFRLDGADDFIRSVGKENAAEVMRQHATTDLAESGAVNKLTGEINTKQLANWMSRNGRVLEKFGIKEDFDTVNAAYALLDDQKEQVVKFGKSVAAKLLNADPQNAIKAAMSGAEGISGRNTGATMSRLMAQLKTAAPTPEAYKTAMTGLKNAFKDFMVSESESTAETIAGDKYISFPKMEAAIKKYEPAMRELYNDEPRKIEAMLKVREAVKIESRTLKSPLGGGSDTAEKMNIAQGTISRLLDHVPGVHYTVRLARVGLKALSNLNALELNNLVARAYNDPELAQTLMMAAKQQAPKEVARRINNQIALLGLGVSVNKPKENNISTSEVPAP
jgi:hypothetical protein